MPTFVNIILCNSQWRDITILLRYCNDALTCHAAFIVLQMSNVFSYLSFTSKSTPWGQFITSVCNMTASTDDRQYWQLLDSNNKPLDKGMNMYTRKVLSVYLNKFSKKPKGQSIIDNPDTLTRLGTQDTGRRQTHLYYLFLILILEVFYFIFHFLRFDLIA